MAQAATANVYVNHGVTSFNVQFISTTTSHNLGHLQDKVSPRQAIFAFLAAMLLNFLQVKFQGKPESPFETHPKTTILAIASLLIYCLAYDAKIRIFNHHHHQHHHHPSSSSNAYISRNNFICCSMAIFGPLSLASILSMLVAERLCPLLFSLATLYTICQLQPNLMRTIWNWLKALIRNKFCSQPQGRTATGAFEFISAPLHLIPESPTIDQIDLIPV